MGIWRRLLNKLLRFVYTFGIIYYMLTIQYGVDGNDHFALL